jgi:hypothetical protein
VSFCKAILGPDGRRVAQVSDRASGAILEGLPSEVEAQAGKALKESGKGGTGRYVVGEDDVDKARELILAAHASRVRAIQAKQTTDKPKADGKPSGKGARVRGASARRGARLAEGAQPDGASGVSSRSTRPGRAAGRRCLWTRPGADAVVGLSSSRSLSRATHNERHARAFSPKGD